MKSHLRILPAIGLATIALGIFTTSSASAATIEMQFVDPDGYAADTSFMLFDESYTPLMFEDEGYTLIEGIAQGNLIQANCSGEIKIDLPPGTYTPEFRHENNSYRDYSELIDGQDIPKPMTITGAESYYAKYLVDGFDFDGNGTVEDSERETTREMRMEHTCTNGIPIIDNNDPIPTPVPTLPPSQNKDYTGHTFEHFIQNLIDDGVVSGYSDGSFKPDEAVTRGAMAKFVKNAFGFQTNTRCRYFNDVPNNHTFFNEITTLKCEGIIGGYSDGTYKPDDLVTRGQAMKFIIEGARKAKNDSNFLNKTQDNKFPDVPNTNTFYEYIMSANSHGIVGGYSNGNFGPNDNVTRGAMAKMIDNTRKEL